MRGQHHNSRSGDFFTKNGESGLRLGICGQEAMGLSDRGLVSRYGQVLSGATWV